MGAKREVAVGVIGCGMLAQATHLKHLNEIEGARLKWACDVSAAALASVSSRFHPQKTTNDYREVTEDNEVDAIVLATAQEMRLPVIEAAARAGKGVYCEKPMANTLAEMENIRAAVDRSGICFCVGHNRRSAPSMLRARALFLTQRRAPAPCPWRLDRNATLRERWPEEDQAFVIIRINDDLLSWKPWAVTDAMMAGGPMLFEMTHFTDLACWFIESPPLSVVSIGHHRTNHTVVIRFADGSLATILETGVGTFGYPKELYELYANGAAVVLDHFIHIRTGGMEGVPQREFFPLKGDSHLEVSAGGGIRDFYAKRRAAELDAMQAGAPMTALETGPDVDKGHKAHRKAVHRRSAWRGAVALLLRRLDPCHAHRLRGHRKPAERGRGRAVTARAVVNNPSGQ